ncbi:MAG: hypothetical protein AB2L20_11220 [Mangrovibacterium sp.]
MIRRFPTFEEPKKPIEATQMSVPGFQSLMLPLLKATSNGKQWQFTAIREELALKILGAQSGSINR